MLDARDVLAPGDKVPFYVKYVSATEGIVTGSFVPVSHVMESWCVSVSFTQGRPTIPGWVGHGLCTFHTRQAPHSRVGGWTDPLLCSDQTLA